MLHISASIGTEHSFLNGFPDALRATSFLNDNRLEMSWCLNANHFTADGRRTDHGRTTDGGRFTFGRRTDDGRTTDGRRTDVRMVSEMFGWFRTVSETFG